MSSQDPTTNSSDASRSGSNGPGSPRPPCFIGLGANLESTSGSPAETVLAAAQALVPLSAVPVLLSSLWQTTPLDCPPGSPVFINAVAAIVPLATFSHDHDGAIALLHELQRIEARFGRLRGDQLNAPRTLDVDMLSWGQLLLATSELTLPHPRMGERRFVLEPLAQIAPGLLPPGFQRPVAAVLAELPGQGEIERIKLDAASVSLIAGVYTTDSLSS